jgi:hypothetical protein
MNTTLALNPTILAAVVDQALKGRNDLAGSPVVATSPASVSPPRRVP